MDNSHKALAIYRLETANQELQSATILLRYKGLPTVRIIVFFMECAAS